MTIPVVISRTVPKMEGICTTLPATMITAMVSPMALPTPKITPAKIPDFAAGTVTLKIVFTGVVPRAREASR